MGRNLKNPAICYNPGYFLDTQNCDGCSLGRECERELNGKDAESNLRNQEVVAIKQEE